MERIELPSDVSVVAPDGSEVRVLATATRGSMAHFRLGEGDVSIAKAHRTIEELWDALPLSPVGKVLKRKIREPYWVDHTRSV